MQSTKINLFGFKGFIIIIIILGIFFRFYQIDRKSYWIDEVFTSLRVSGYTVQEFKKQIYNNSVVDIQDLQKYQKLNGEKSSIDTIKGLSKEEPQITPLYFILTQFWLRLWDHSIATTRNLAALFSTFSILGIYLLCQELFNLSLIGWIAMALIAISPFQILYAQEARPYSLWTLIILVSSWLLLRALRLQEQLSWKFYTISSVLSLYTSFSSLFVLAAHGVYVLLSERFRYKPNIRKYLISLTITIIAFSPWLLVFFTGIEQARRTTEWTSHNYGRLFLLFNWLKNLTRIFADFSFLETSNRSILQNYSPFLFLMISIFILVIYSFYYLYLQAPRNNWLFIILLSLTVLPFVLPDLLIGGKRSIIMRYLIPAYLMINLSVAYLLASKIFSKLAKPWNKKLWSLVFLGLICIGMLSNIQIAKAQVWWHKDSSRYSQNSEIIQLVNQTEKPLIISDTRQWTDLITLSYRFDPQVKFLLLNLETDFEIPDGFSDYFLYQPSSLLKERLKQNQGIAISPLSQRKNPQLWRYCQARSRC